MSTLFVPLSMLVCLRANNRSCPCVGDRRRTTEYDLCTQLKRLAKTQHLGYLGVCVVPTIAVEHGMTIKLYWADEHDPAHVHVMTPDWEIRAYIGDTARYWDTKWGFPRKKENDRAIELVASHLGRSNEKWEEGHGR